MKFILGQKVGMTRVYDDKGKIIPVTLVKAGPCTVAQVKTDDKEGYKAVQIGFGNRRKISKALQGHLKDFDNFRFLKEFKIEDSAAVKKGDQIKADVFEIGDKVKVVGTSKGKGFQGVVKRHNFSGGPATHGHRHDLRQAGSVGGAYPQHVLKGQKMAGRMGADKVTIKNTSVVKVDAKENIIAIKGSIPGIPKGLVSIQVVK